MSFRKGDTIYRLDDAANSVFWIEQGRAKVVKISPDGQEKIVGIYKSGELFGELCMCEIARRRDQAVALEPLEALSIRVDGLLKLMAERPEFSQALLQTLCRRVLEYQEQVATLSFDPVSRRLAKELMRLSETERQESLQNSVSTATGWTHEDLANLVGTTREVVTLLMNQFREKRMIDYSRKNIVVFPSRIKEFLANEN